MEMLFYVLGFVTGLLSTSVFRNADQRTRSKANRMNRELDHFVARDALLKADVYRQALVGYMRENGIDEATIENLVDHIEKVHLKR